MPPSKKDELSEAVDSGEPDNVARVTKKGVFNPQGKTAMSCLTAACSKGSLAIVEILVNWGTPADSVDEVGRKGLQMAAERGSHEIVALLCEREADPNAVDSGGSNAMNLALNAPHLKVVKELLKAGAELPGTANVPGLAGIVREVQLEKLTNELTDIANNTQSCDKDLERADGAVWAAMNEHMRLLQLREDQKAGKMLIDLQKELEESKKDAVRAKENEAMLMKELIDKKIVLQKASNSLEDLKRSLDHAERIREKCVAEDTEANSEVATQKSDLDKAKKEWADAETLFADKEKERDGLGARQKELQDELAAAKERHQRLKDLLRSESAELRGWERDKEYAAQLTAQAGRILGKENVRD
mmetsp:Transcript_136693/g.237726  ORF Transcript_136693/g.237726 Transcript_136693/m.237726 type:complete len:360 (-) Transcript_136693:52-1131(-)